MVQVICQDAEKHAVKMMAELHRMKRENDHCDFIIQVGDDVYYTNKNVLSAGSDYFKAMLKHDTKESREGKVVLKEVDLKCVKNCIDFIYSGKFEIPDKKMNDLLHVAIMMQLEDVKQVISDILKESISVDNYFSTKNVADMYGLDAVSVQCRLFFHENIMEISNQPEFGNIGKNKILTLLKSQKYRLCDKEKLMLSLRWIGDNRRERFNLWECLKVIKFEKISSSFLQHLLERHPIISNDFTLYKMINQHLLKASKIPDKRKEKTCNDEIIIFDNDMDCIRSFNPVTEKIEKFHDEKFKHLQYFGTISHDSYIYVLCTDKSVHRLDFQIRNSKWEKMKDMICDHGEIPHSVSLSGSIFVIGGSHPRATSDVEGFDSFLNQWIQLEGKPKAISSTSLVSLNDSIYCIGGVGQDGASVSSFCRFTPSSSEWVDLEPMRYPVCYSGVVAVDQKIFVIGGKRRKKSLNNVECYDVTSAQWTSLSSMNDCHYRVFGHHINNWIFTVSAFETSNVFEKYDISNDKWIIVKPKVDQCFKIYKSTFVQL